MEAAEKAVAGRVAETEAAEMAEGEWVAEGTEEEGSMALQASALDELRGAPGRLGYLCAGGAKAMLSRRQAEGLRHDR